MVAHGRIAALALIAACFFVAAQGPSRADYPDKPIRLLLPFPAGGAVDIVARVMAAKMADDLGKPFVIENRAGAGGIIATDAVAKAPPDGYTLLLVSPTFTINPAIRKTMPFDTVRDFTPVAFIARAPLLVTTSTRLPVQSASELFALARSKPGQITYASSGLGSINQISAELIALSAGASFTHVPYKGGALALNDLVGGFVDIYVSSLPQVLQLAQSGQARALAVTSARRTALLPDVPTLAEAGISGVDLWSWWGIVGPAGMPADIVNALNAEIGKMLTSPELGKFLASEGAEAETMTPQQFGDMMRLETERWTKVAHEANISID
jgi:tripartite-type tricarboxylate transporter receptor subunit TctC